MLRSLRLRRIHGLFLESCRNLKEGRDYWSKIGCLKRWILQCIAPEPLMSLLKDGDSLADALKALERTCSDVPLSESVVREYHRMVLPAHPQAGEYRKVPVTMVGSPVITPNASRIPALMKHLDGKLAHQQSLWDARIPSEDEVLHFAMDVFQRIGYVHPFIDGNGRVSRIAMNHILRRYRVGYVVFPALSENQDLLGALLEGHRGQLSQLIAMARSRVHRV